MCTNLVLFESGIEEYEQGKVHRMEEGESVDGFLSRMINED